MLSADLFEENRGRFRVLRSLNIASCRLAWIEYVLVICVIVLGWCRWFRTAYLLLAAFLTVTITIQKRAVSRFRYETMTCSDQSIFQPVRRAIPHRDEPQVVFGLEFPMSQENFGFLLDMPTSVQALSTGLVLGQSLNSVMWDAASQAKWKNDWEWFPPVANAGLPVCFAVSKAVGYVVSLWHGYSFFNKANEGDNFLKALDALTCSADCWNNLLISETAAFVNAALLGEEVAAGRSARFTTKVCIGAIGQLWFKISILRITFLQLIRSPLEFANMLFAIACGFYTICQQCPTQFRFALQNKGGFHNAGYLKNLGTSRTREISKLVIAVILAVMCFVQFVSAFTCLYSHPWYCFWMSEQIFKKLIPSAHRA